MFTVDPVLFDARVCRWCPIVNALDERVQSSVTSLLTCVQVVSECRRIGRAGAVFSYVVADMTQYHTQAPKVIHVSLYSRSDILVYLVFVELQ